LSRSIGPCSTATSLRKSDPALATANEPADPTTLIAKARAALGRAHAPYSQFPVAAAVVDDRGETYVGVNVENVSYGLTMCAERVAIFSAIASGARRIVAVAITSKNGTSVAPCGACRQVMAEFCRPDTAVTNATAAVANTVAIIHLMTSVSSADRSAFVAKCETAA